MKEQWITLFSLSFVFRSVYTETTYNTQAAKSRTLQLPVVAIQIGSPSSETSEIMEMENMSRLMHDQFNCTNIAL